MFGLKPEVEIDGPNGFMSPEDYEKAQNKWCPGCGDAGILTAVQKLCSEKQLDPDKTVFVSGIGCSSRFPHYMKTYGFHGLHGRAFPVAEGIKFRRPDLDVFVITGDGDCCSIGAGAWIHAIRYNINMTVLLFNNEIYGLTKKQMSPTSRQGTISNTSPRGSFLPPLNPLQVTLGVANASFVAQTCDWNAKHLAATIKAAHAHKGFSFVHILQRCPVFQPDLSKEMAKNRDGLNLLVHENGITLDEAGAKMIKNHSEHDPSDIHAARELAEDKTRMHLGLLYHNPENECYDDYGASNLGYSVDQKMEVINGEFDKYAI